jgi:hypothetical protein
MKLAAMKLINLVTQGLLFVFQVSFYYTKEKVIFEKVCMSATMESRIAVVGLSLVFSVVRARFVHLYFILLIELRTY